MAPIGYRSVASMASSLIPREPRPVASAEFPLAPEANFGDFGVAGMHGGPDIKSHGERVARRSRGCSNNDGILGLLLYNYHITTTWITII